MRLSLLLLVGIRMAMDYHASVVMDAVDAVCGSKNFTDAFWSARLVENVMDYVARDTIRNNASLCAPVCVEEIDKTHHGRLFAPLAQSFRHTFQSMENKDAKGYIDKVYANALSGRTKWLSPKANLGAVMAEFGGKMKLILDWHRMSMESKIAYAQAMKRAFGYVETGEMRRYRIETAMNAFESTEAGREDKEIAALIGQLQELLNGTTAFDYFASHWMKFDEHAEWIRPVEVVPAIETLYLQYRTLTNKETKTFVDSFLASWKDQYEGHVSDYFDYFDYDTTETKRKPANGKQSKSAFDALSDETVSALTSAFPELFAYLYKHGYIARKTLGIF